MINFSSFSCDQWNHYYCLVCLWRDIERPVYHLLHSCGSHPRSANFFTNYVMLAGLSGPSVDLLQLAPLVVSPILVYFFGNTPRTIHSVMQPVPFRYSEIVAYHNFFAVLGLIYITIAPLVVVMVSLYFSFYFFRVLLPASVHFCPPLREWRKAFVHGSAASLCWSLYHADSYDWTFRSAASLHPIWTYSPPSYLHSLVHSPIKEVWPHH
ncbi:hypothetical protein BC829DRAFT_257813 [Chytridium lagenaria]|nr:hypothetical protein BC829DRAFT_257813 [Chytridium lagenaria]